MSDLDFKHEKKKLTIISKKHKLRNISAVSVDTINDHVTF